MRKVIPGRRHHVTIKLSHGDAKFYIGYGHVPGESRICEVFADAKKTGSDIQATLSDACIAISLLLQLGMTLEQLVASFGELRDEGAKSGPPASILGIIVRAGVELEKTL